jgi:hypothetical protein
MDALKGLAPDVTAPKAAYQMLKKFNSKDQAVHHDTSDGDLRLADLR